MNRRKAVGYLVAFILFGISSFNWGYSAAIYKGVSVLEYRAFLSGGIIFAAFALYLLARSMWFFHLWSEFKRYKERGV